MTNAIEAKGLTKQFGERKAVDGVSFSVPEGAFLSIFGPNGAGKTTLLRMLSTVSRPTEGSARVCGIDLKEDAEAARARIGLISHQPMLYPDLSALQNLRLFAELYGVEDAEARVMRLLEAVELKHRRFDEVKTFSRGMTQRLAIARALVHDPSVVFLDEPYSGLDPHAMEVFDQLIAEVRQNRTFVMVSHDLEKGYAMCTHALALARGRAVIFGARDDVSQDALRGVYGGLAGAAAPDGGSAPAGTEVR